jgi:predicted enzyme related to lactoylglutathione lyase
MLRNASITPIVHVADLERARKFYQDVLGLREDLGAGSGNVVFTAADGAHLELMVKPESVSTDATVLTFEVEDVEREADELTKRGARFEAIEIPGGETVGVITTIGDERAGWFKDSEGNWLCIHDRAPNVDVV